MENEFVVDKEPLMNTINRFAFRVENLLAAAALPIEMGAASAMAQGSKFAIRLAGLGNDV